MCFALSWQQFLNESKVRKMAMVVWKCLVNISCTSCLEITIFPRNAKRCSISFVMSWTIHFRSTFGWFAVHCAVSHKTICTSAPWFVKIISVLPPVDICSGNKTAFTYCIVHFRVPNANELHFPQGRLSVRREPIKIDFFRHFFFVRCRCRHFNSPTISAF